MRDSFNEINITPLTDIFLVLLIIMMVIAPLLDQQGLNLTVPSLVEENQVKESKILEVNITDDDRYIIGNEEVSVNDLESVLKEKAPNYPDGLLVLSSSESTYNSVVRLMDIARSSGITSISMSEGD
ncbi:biopolymer transporter ExbD [bacterium]|nr:biopolymer transporter ExbD [bacterium]